MSDGEGEENWLFNSLEYRNCGIKWDSDCDSTTEESEFGSSVSSPEPPIVMAEEVQTALKDLKFLQMKYYKLQLEVTNWNKATIGDGTVKVISNRLEDFYKQLEVLYGQVYEFSSDVEFQKLGKDMDDMRSAMDTTMAIIIEIIESRKQSNTGTGGAPVTSVKLPKLDLPNFDGKVEDWLSFRDLFLASVGKSTKLSGSQKLQYLKSCLKGEAENVVKSFSITDINYNEAWQLMESRYDNKRDIIFTLIRKFINQANVTKDPAKGIRKLIDVSLECVRSLQGLNQPVDEWNAVLVCVMVDKLDPEAKKDWMKTLTGQTVPLFKDLVEFLETHVKSLIAVGGTKSAPSGSSGNVLKSGSHHSTSKPLCPMCTQDHGLFKCSTFIALVVSDRESFVKVKRLCFNCFSSQHGVSKCTSKFTCGKCHKKHNTLLHREEPAVTPEVESPQTTTALTAKEVVNVKNVLLSTALVKIRNSAGSYNLCRALLDSGSESSFVTQKCVQALGIKPTKCNVEISGLSSSSVGRSRGRVDLDIESVIKNFKFNVNALILPTVTSELPSFKVTGNWEYLAGLQLADPRFMDTREVDLILGEDIIEYLWLAGRVMRDRKSPVARESELGWVVGGPVDSCTEAGTTVTNFSSEKVHHCTTELDSTVKRFWELEQVPDHPQWNVEEKECEEHFRNLHYREEGGRYVAPLPFNNKITDLGGSRVMALKRLEYVERRLSRGPHKDQYVKFMRDYERLGHMVEIEPKDCGEVVGKTNYLPHHFVLREESTSTKLRVVFDGSAKSSSGLSLNKCLMVGPKVQDDLFFHLLRFRLHPVALKADVVKMFRQFLVPDKDRDFQRILWRESVKLPVKEYKLKTVTYGTSSAPYAAARCMQQLGLDYATESPTAAAAFRKNFYVDDLLVSVPTVKDGIELQVGIDKLAAKGCLEVGKWDSNILDVLQNVSVVNRAKNENFKLEDTQFVSKALGVSWDSVKDVLLFQGYEPREDLVVTKRSVLSEMARVFDPLGLISPVTVKVKIFLQRLWTPIENENGETLVLGWDDPVPAHLKEEWDVYLAGLSKVNLFEVPRVLLVAGTQNYELHGFSDASEESYSAVVYTRCFLEDGSIVTNLACAKTKVAPLKQQSIPKLELCGALLLSRLMTAVLQATGLECPIHLWTDSEVTHRWISSESRKWKTFVANRVAEIQEAFNPNCWRFIPGELNPADCASRGLTADELLHFDLWWKGPEFLSQPGLPLFVGKMNPPEIELEQKSKFCHTALVRTEIIDVLLHKHSSLRTIKRVLAYLLRYNHNCLRKLQPRLVGELSVSELKSAMIRLIQAAQSEFHEEKTRLIEGKAVRNSSKLVALNPFVDKNGVIRVGGRLQKSKLPEKTKHPIILPGSHRLTKLLVQDEHKNQLHAGFQLLWAGLQREYWIIRARSSIRDVLRNCLRCKRLKAKTAHQLMGTLPAGRVTPSKPFQHSGVDYAGPFSLSLLRGRGNKASKGYLCLFVCLATKAVHLEVAMDLSTDSFIAAFKRFVARRGMPSHMYSDCGTNFVGAQKELKALLESSEHNNKMSSFLVDRGIEWRFNSPAAPNQGGLWEAGVKGVKYHLRRVIGDTILTQEEFRTVLAQIEAALNSRPIGAMTSDPVDMEVLTPGHFLIGEPLTAIPEPALDHIPINRLSRWQRTQQMFQHFWNRWSKEYLHQLQERGKWRKKTPNFQVGDLVLIKEDDLPPLKWKMGRVQQVQLDAENLVRNALLKTVKGELTRSVVKLVPLLCAEDL